MDLRVHGWKMISNPAVKPKITLVSSATEKRNMVLWSLIVSIYWMKDCMVSGKIIMVIQFKGKNA
jgi:hypothetical protein